MENNIENIINEQKKFFKTGATLTTEFRKNALLKLKDALKEFEPRILQALKTDLNKSETESFLGELSLIKSELIYALKNVAKWNKPKRKFSSNSIRPAKSYIYRTPYGTTLILGPWNYPVQLSLLPLVGAIACGNTVILKTSRNSKAVSDVIHEMISKSFDAKHIYHVPSDIDYDVLLDNNYDLIFFTGSPSVGKKIMAHAAKNLTPVILELGGKSPCIINEDANVEIAAKRIVFGKLLNAGQTCVAPDYFLVHESIKDEFVKYLQQYIQQMYGEACENNDYVRIVNKKHYDRLNTLIENHKKIKPVIGGKRNDAELKISPAILLDTTFEDEIMKDEIFGPIFPIVPFSSLDEALEKVKKMPKPLAFYFFSKNLNFAKKVVSSMQYGGACINDCIIHLSNHHIPFGGIGSSGMGSYHGKYSFESFTHVNGVVVNRPNLDLPLRYPPFSNFKKKLFKVIL